MVATTDEPASLECDETHTLARAMRSLLLELREHPGVHMTASLGWKLDELVDATGRLFERAAAAERECVRLREQAKDIAANYIALKAKVGRL